jgi:1-acyl-sn-glycerol-3-phosphate acyltransferase
MSFLQLPSLNLAPADAPHVPDGYTPPARPNILDALRTALAACAIVPSYFGPMALHRVRAAPATTTTEGLEKIRKTSKRALRLLGIELEVFGEQHVPAQGGLIFMWNQESHLDHLVLAATLPRPFYLLFNTEVFRTPIYGKYLKDCGHIWIDRNDEEQWRAAMADAAFRVQQGACMLVSPEGTRSWDGQLLPMKRGAFLLAEQALRPIVCVTVIGGHQRMPRGTAVVRPGPMRVVFSSPLDIQSDSEQNKQAVVHEFETTKRAYGIG